jgi:DNA-binding MarR family transcriptional regulator
MRTKDTLTQVSGRRLTKADLEILRHFARFPRLYPEQVVAVARVAPKSVSERLRRLVEAGLLCFPRAVRGMPDHFLFPRVLAITPAGLREVQRSLPRQRVAPAVVAGVAWAKKVAHA